jgi:hypothetical protein
VILAAVAGFAFSRGSAPLARADYGPNGARFVVAFASRPEVRDLDETQQPNRYLEDVTPKFSLYVAQLGSNS